MKYWPQKKVETRGRLLLEDTPDATPLLWLEEEEQQEENVKVTAPLLCRSTDMEIMPKGSADTKSDP